MSKHKQTWLLILCLGFSMGVAAPGSANTIVLVDELLTPELFPEAASAIQHNMQFISDRDLSPARRATVVRSLERIGRFLADDPDRHRLRIQMEQRRVNSMLTVAVATNQAGADVVCRRIKDVGTNIWRTQCRNRADLDEQNYAARSLLESGVGCGGLTDRGICPQTGNKVRINE